MLKTGICVFILIARLETNSAQFEKRDVFSLGSEKWPDIIIGGVSDQCFCKLQGKVDDCSCQVDTVGDFNNKKIFPRLQSLLQKDYFRYFQYHPSKPCPFWDGSVGKCKAQMCRVKNCEESDLPSGLVGKNGNENGHTRVVENKYTGQGHGDSLPACDDHDDNVDSTMSVNAIADLALWKRHDEENSPFCEVDSQDCDDCVHVDLSLNPERYTGYSGESSQKIWRSVYEENCFSPDGSSTKGPFSSAFGHEKLANLCLEKRAFFRAVSGLHTSITIHLSSRYPLSKNSAMPFVQNQEKWGHNLELFLERFDPERTNGQGPYWLKNLYFVYLLELRALAKAEAYLTQQKFFTGNDDEDKDTLIAVKELLSLIKSFPDHFDETSLFSGGLQAQELKQEFVSHFRNISRLMDCVNCDKCRLWGKLQVTGLGTALKILFSGEFDKPRLAGLPVANRDLKLSRQEVVTLFNAFGRISTSIFQLEHFRHMIKKEQNLSKGRSFSKAKNLNPT